MAAKVSWKPGANRLEGLIRRRKKALKESMLKVCVPPKQFSQEKGHGHYCGSEDRRPALNEQDIKQKKNDNQRIRHARRNPDEAKEGKKEEGKDGDVGSGDGKKMEETGILERSGDGRGNSSPLSQKESLEDRTFGG